MRNVKHNHLFIHLFIDAALKLPKKKITIKNQLVLEEYNLILRGWLWFSGRIGSGIRSTGHEAGTPRACFAIKMALSLARCTDTIILVFPISLALLLVCLSREPL